MKVGRTYALSIVLAVGVAVGGCSGAPSESEIKQAIDSFMHSPLRGRLDEPYLNLNRLCSNQGAETAEFLAVERVIEIDAPKRTAAQGLYHYYTKTIWPVKVEMSLQCQRDELTAPLTSTQDFALWYDGHSWTVSDTQWRPWWEEGPVEHDVLVWELYTALISGAVIAFLSAASSRSNMNPWLYGFGNGHSVSFVLTIILGVYVGLKVHIVGTDPPGLAGGLTFGFLGAVIGLIAGAVGACAGSLCGNLLGRILKSINLGSRPNE